MGHPLKEELCLISVVFQIINC